MSPAAATSSALLSNRNDSRETMAKPPADFSVGARIAYSARDPTMKKSNSPRMNMPSDGSEANACTETTKSDTKAATKDPKAGAQAPEKK